MHINNCSGCGDVLLSETVTATWVAGCNTNNTPPLQSSHHIGRADFLQCHPDMEDYDHK